MNRKHLCMGVIAHVDSGKTTLSESILYHCGKIRKMGRVDNGDAYLDTDQMEKDRGITIFSKQAEFLLGDRDVTLVDTPGHVDFSAEMERTLQVLDYAILVINGSDGVQGHTLTLWRLLKRYHIPTFLFINKMDQARRTPESLMEEIQTRLDRHCVSFTKKDELFFEEVAVCDDGLLEKYLESNTIEKEEIKELIASEKLYPCFFGSALKGDGVDSFLKGLEEYTKDVTYGDLFGARVFKIARDEQNNRLTYMKITGGSLKVRQKLTNKGEQEWEEKVNQIRVYSGEQYEAVPEVQAGMICAVTGLSHTYAGEGLGIEKEANLPLLEPVLTYAMILPDDISVNQFLPQLRQLEEEEPELKIVWNEKVGEIQAQIMGEVQIEILRCMIRDRFKADVHFGEGKIVYKETILDTVEGVGHFEPLRHYAEVHLKIEPGEHGSGVQVLADCSEDLLAKNWQRLILTHLTEREFIGVLAGKVLTDVKITLVSGKAHIKHTEGGDFRQATYRAVRQGLMKAQSCLLEPYYAFRLEIPAANLGRAMMDLEKKCASFKTETQDDKQAVLVGIAPVATMRNYQQEVHSYTKGTGRIICSLKGYYPCHNEEEVLENSRYDPDADIANPSASVFCSHGSGIVVPWYEVEQKMHLPLQTGSVQEEAEEPEWQARVPKPQEEYFMGEEEINRIFEQTYGANKRKGSKKMKKRIEKRVISHGSAMRPKKSDEQYLLVDGYNIVFAWQELSELAKDNIDAARGRLMDIMCNYQGYKKCTLILVFDAYRVKGNVGQMIPYHNIHVVYTKEAETADQYIEKLAHKMGRDYHVTVATSDGLEQLIIRGQGCRLISAREFYEEVKQVEEEIRKLI